MTGYPIASNWISAIGRMVRQGPSPYVWAWTDRQQQYKLYEGYLDNSIYESIASGGQRENLNAVLGNASAADLAGFFNPVSAVVGLYNHILGGSFGLDITAVTGNDAIIEPLEHIWQWSNLNIEKQLICKWAANLGCVGLRVVAEDDLDPAKRRVYLKPEHPRIIKDVQLDRRGNVEAIQLEYTEQAGLGEQAVEVEFREELTKEHFKKWKISNGSVLSVEYDDPNPLGVVPYVLLRHEHDGTAWGRNAWYRARPGMDRLNALASHIDVEIHRHVRATWLIAAAGAPPAEFTFNDMKVLYVDMRNSSVAPSAKAMVADLNIADAISQAKVTQGWIEDQLPELKATQGAFLSGQSGETIAELRKPAEDRLALARGNYEDAILRSQKIALSYGILLELWDLGTGMGTREAADAAYQQGLEDHTFNDRPLLGAQTKAEQAPQQAGDQGQQAPMMEQATKGQQPPMDTSNRPPTGNSSAG